MKRRTLFRKLTPLALLPLGGVLFANTRHGAPDTVTPESLVAEIESLVDTSVLGPQGTYAIEQHWGNLAITLPYITLACVAESDEEALRGLRSMLLDRIARRRQREASCHLIWRFPAPQIHVSDAGENIMARTRLRIVN